MPKQQFAMEKNGPKRLALSWSGLWKNFTATLDGAVVLEAHGSADLKAGKSAVLPDGSTLAIRLQSGFGNAGLAVTRDGLPLPGSTADPETQAKTAGWIVYFLAGLNLLIGVIALAFDVRFLKDNFGYGPLVVGAVFGVLGFFTMKRSLAALIIAIVLYALDGVITLGMQFADIGHGRTPNMGFIFMRVIFLMAMIRGARALSQLAAEGRTP